MILLFFEIEGLAGYVDTNYPFIRNEYQQMVQEYIGNST